MLVCETVYSHNDTITYKCLFSSKKIRKKEKKAMFRCWIYLQHSECTTKLSPLLFQKVNSVSAVFLIAIDGHFLSGHTAESLVQIYAQFFVLNERTKHLYWYQAVCSIYECVVFPTCHMTASVARAWLTTSIDQLKNMKSFSLWK